jgi:hypothetical protein
VAGVGAAGLKGPGAPIEAGASSVLPEGKMLTYFKVDHAQFKTYDWAAPNEKYARFTMLGLGYGFTPAFSAYLFVPYHEKISEDSRLDSRGVADISLMAQLGFKYDNGLQLIPKNESLDDMEDWHFSLFFGSTLPTGNPNHRLADGTLDPGKAHGFGKPAYTLGLTATRPLSDRLTVSFEASMLRFQEYTYEDGQKVRFGNEDRFNTAFSYRAYTNDDAMFRLDPVLELQYLGLGRDVENGVGATAAGGKIIYTLLGARAYWGGASFAFGYKLPVSAQLNEADQQQGAEGKEKYRFIFSASKLF